MSGVGTSPAGGRRWPLVALAIVAVVPPLLSSPGRMPADSKLYLYLDPRRFLADAAGTFDPRQFAGWVPHQHLSYLWPSGPWYVLADGLGLPDWVAQRLWVGAVCLAAGAGAWKLARELGLGPPAALTAALAYQLSPYVLPYLARTSVMLLPWAGLGWIVLFTWRAVRGGWRYPAAIGLVVLTVGAVNATALAMIVPAPVLVLVHAAAGGGRRAWVRSLRVAGRIAVTCVAASLWWIVQLGVQRRYGADVLAYSEALADVATTSTSTEVWRQLGYWLFYVRDVAGPATSASLRHLVSSWSIAVGFAVPALGLVGLARSRWVHRRLALAWIAAGGLLAVGVHPHDDRPPLVDWITFGDDGGLALALRSSTRALPMLALGTGLGLGLLATTIADVLRRRGVTVDAWTAATPVVVLVALNLPGWWTASVVVDPMIDRDQDPPAPWRTAAAVLDERAAGDPLPGRVLQLPGSEFGSFAWGHTADPPLPGLTERPLVTRDLLPLGAPAAMDLLLALDDRFQTGTAEPDAVGPVARMLGVDTIWLANDLADDRFDTARPGIVRDVVARSAAVASIAAIGAVTEPAPETERTDATSLADPRATGPLPPVELAELPSVGVVRVADGSVLVAGSGDGVVDAAAAGLLDGPTVVRYAAAVDELPGAVDAATAVVVTDSNRQRARHWRSSQDTVGMTESADQALHPRRRPAGDSRLPVFEAPGPDLVTTAEQHGPLRATADWYGQPFAYLPEHRPVAAVDGDLDTAWLVGEHADPTGVGFHVEVPDGVTEVAVVQQPDPSVRHITGLDVVGPDGATRHVELGAASFTDLGQPVPVPSGRVELRIAEVAGGVPSTAGAVAPVGFRELRHDGPPTVEVIELPQAALDLVDADTPLAIVVTRDRVDPADHWRDDPESSMVRAFDLPAARTMRAVPTLRVDRRADDAALADILGWPVVADSRLAGMPRAAGVFATDGDPSTSWITEFGEALGASLEFVADRPLAEITLAQPSGGFSQITEVTITGSDGRSVADRLGGPSGPDPTDPATIRLDPPLPAGATVLTITGIEPSTTRDRRFGDVRELPAALSEVTSPSIAVVDPTPDRTLGCTTVAVVAGAPIEVSPRLAGDEWMGGAPLDWERCDAGPIDLPSGTVRVEATTVDLPLHLDRLVLDDGATAALEAAAAEAVATVHVDHADRFSRTATVTGCDDGCWFVLGEGYSTAWRASLDGVDLGAPALLDGGFTGWRIPPGASPRVVEARWSAQWPLTAALIASGLSALALVALVILGPGRTGSGPSWSGTGTSGRTGRRAAAIWVAGVVGLVAWSWWPIALVGGAALWWRGARARPVWWAIGTVAVTGSIVVLRERRYAPLPDGAWPAQFADLHRLGVAALVATAVAAVVARPTGEVDDRA